jgi:histidinol-phosphatase (PHP family)
MGVIQVDTLSKQFDDFIAEAHRLKQLYAPQITLLVGLETDYITNTDLDGLESLLQRHGDYIEYIVGSIHHVNGIPIDFDLPTYRKALESFGPGIEKEDDKQEAFMLAYFDAQYELIQRFKPEVIGHFDLCRLYKPNLRFADFPVVQTMIERNIRFAVDYGALFEINTAALRKLWPSPYPAKDVVEASYYY